MFTIICIKYKKIDLLTKIILPDPKFVFQRMFAWRLIMANMISIDGSYWELFLVQQILQRGMLLGDQFRRKNSSYTKL